jgi:hypothetical protein
VEGFESLTAIEVATLLDRTVGGVVYQSDSTDTLSVFERVEPAASDDAISPEIVGAIDKYNSALASAGARMQKWRSN